MINIGEGDLYNKLEYLLAHKNTIDLRAKSLLTTFS
jgi:hypothetical protein